MPGMSVFFEFDCHSLIWHVHVATGPQNPLYSNLYAQNKMIVVLLEAGSAVCRLWSKGRGYGVDFVFSCSYSA